MLLVALAGTLSYSGSAEQLLNRFGAVSSLPGIRYWSVSDRDWRVLVTEAAAIVGSDSSDRRPDFSAAEMKPGRNLYFAQRDSRSTGEVVYRLRVLESGADRLVVEVENVTAVHAFVVTLFSPGAIKTIYFLDRLGGGSWGFYALLAADSSYAAGNEASLINRAVTLYRHFAGVPTDGAPPLAR